MEARGPLALGGSKLPPYVRNVAGKQRCLSDPRRDGRYSAGNVSRPEKPPERSPDKHEYTPAAVRVDHIIRPTA